MRASRGRWRGDGAGSWGYWEGQGRPHLFLIPPPYGEGGRPIGRSGGGKPRGQRARQPPSRPPLRSADPPHKGEGSHVVSMEVTSAHQLPCLYASWIALAAASGVMLPPAISAVTSLTTRPTDGPKLLS